MWFIAGMTDITDYWNLRRNAGNPEQKEKKGMMKDIADALRLNADILTEACDRIRSEGTSCVVIRDDEIIHSADGRGVAPLLALYNQHRDKLKGSCVVDRIVGKAAAMILVLGEVKAVYGDVMSEAAREYLTARGMPFRCGSYVDVISAQTGTGICPIESSVLAIDDPVAGLAAVIQRVAELQQAAG